jgi:hypothetical protein
MPLVSFRHSVTICTAPLGTSEMFPSVDTPAVLISGVRLWLLINAAFTTERPRWVIEACQVRDTTSIVTGWQERDRPPGSARTRTSAPAMAATAPDSCPTVPLRQRVMTRAGVRV